MKPSEYGIYARELTHRYDGRTVLDDIALRVGVGEFFGFLGQNGAGKSTAIRALCGFLPPTQGAIWVAGVNVIQNPLAVKRLIGVVSDDIVLYERLSGREFLEFVGQMHGLTEKEARARTLDLQERLDLTSAANRPIGTYSLGMKKKTAFAAALIHAPQVLFLDEPFNGVDAASTRALCVLLTQLRETCGVTVFFTSHVLEMAERLCTQVAILQNGRIQQQGTVADLKQQASQQGATLEDIFLQLTGANSAIASPPHWYRAVNP